MAAFEYTAKDAAGNKFSGTYTEVDNIKALKRSLEKLGYVLIKAKREKASLLNKKNSLKKADIVSFAYEFAGMYKAGLSIIRCLETYEAQLESSAFKNVISDIRQSIETGATLKEAFGKYNYVFSDFFVGMIASGETGGKLADTLHMAAVYLEKQAEIKAKIKAALAYPVIVCVMCCLIVTALVIFIVPVFQKLYSQLNITLPVPTLVLIAISQAVRQYWPVILSVVVITGFALPRLLKKPSVKAFIDRVKLRLPLLGGVNRMILVSRYIRTFSMMASAGVPIVEAISMARQVANNAYMDEVSMDIENKIQTGNSFSETISEHSIFPPIIVQLAGSGEEAGVLPQMLVRGVDFFDKKIDRQIQSLLTKIEPILSVILGLIVGTIMLGVYLPMFDYMAQVK